MRKMITWWICLAAILLSYPQAHASKEHPIQYTIDMTGPSTDTFLVEIKVPKLRRENRIFQFAATAPGTYQVMDIGRFVSHFRAYDKSNQEIPVEKIQINQFEISRPARVTRITYQVAETWDTHVNENPIYQMSGSSLEKDHALINVHTLLGYFHGMQNKALEIALVHPEGWLIGTSLHVNTAGLLTAPDFDFAVDSPILLGRLTTAVMEIGGKKVEIFTYSKKDLIKSSDLMESMRDIFTATNTFVKGFPIDRYVLLFHFEDVTIGAWEHSYSSEYVMKEAPLDMAYANQINGIAAHEIFHMITPLNIHSEVIEHFNFVRPAPSQHLWLYEGVTEWASDMIQLRGGLISLSDYLDQITEKLTIDGYYDKTVSLKQLALTSYTPEGSQQYINIYYRGALVPLLMDIQLLEKTGGKRGLREVIIDLARKYGPDKAFSEQNFFAEFVAMTDPEMKTIIDRYIVHAEPLPIAEYFEKIGIRYLPMLQSNEMEADPGHSLVFNGENFIIAQVGKRSEMEGLHANDIVLTINGIDAKYENLAEIAPILHSIKPGDKITYRVRRGEEELQLDLSVGERNKSQKHVFQLMENATPEQLSLRESWMKNLD
jgi:predicted metalloprotease with PDZ domain